MPLLMTMGIEKIWGIESEMFRSWLNLLYYRKTNSTISKKSFDEAYSQIKAFAKDLIVKMR